MKLRNVTLSAVMVCSSTLLAKEKNFDSWIQELESTRGVRNASVRSIVENVSALGTLNSSSLNLKGLIAHTSDGNAIASRVINEEKALAFLSASTVPERGTFIENVLSNEANSFLSYTSSVPGDTITVTLISDGEGEEGVNLRVKWDGGVYKTHKLHFNTNNDQSMSSIQKIVIPIESSGDFDILITDKNGDNESTYSLFVSGASFSHLQRGSNSRAEYLREVCDSREARAQAYADAHNLPLTEYLADGKMRTIIDVIDGTPQYYETFNMDANATTATTKVWPGGGLSLSLTGENFGRSIGIWDGGAVLTSHQEFGGRVTLGDNVATHDHATHVAGTMVASGVVANAKGAAYKARLKSYDWNSDISEMNGEAANGLLVSQHSYGIPGNYNYSRNWDVMANGNPYYLASKSAANEGPAYKTVTLNGNAKNILTVGSCNDLPNGWTGPNVTVSSFSSRGPAPDGRIKPDIMGNGYKVYSTIDQHSSSYGTKSGTSMSGPNVAGSISLLQQHYFETHNSAYMLSHTLKNLVIHTANEVGTEGPDYASGWGVLNMEAAADLITNNEAGLAGLIQELSLSSGATDTHEFAVEGGEEVVVTICWNDPAPSSNSGRALVNDLDLRIEMNGTEYLPWKMNPNSHSSGATKGDNALDNVEQVVIKNPTGSTFSVKVSHKGSLKGSSQKYAMCVSGGTMDVDPFIEVTTPNGGETFIMGNEYELTWSDNLDENVTIDLYKGSSKVKTIETSTASDGSLSWSVPEDLEAGTNYLIKVSGAGVDDVSDDFFEIIARPELEITTPNGGESYANGETMEITWDDNLSGNVDIKLSVGEGNDSTSSNLVLYEGWSAEVDELGSSVDSGSAIVVDEIVDVTIKQVSKSGSDYPWAQLSVYTGDNFRDVDSIEIEYRASKGVLLTLPQEPLSATGESYFTKLDSYSGSGWKKVSMPVNETFFKKPEWSTSTVKLDLTKITSLSFSGDFDSETGGTVDLEIKNIILHGYVEVPSISVASNVQSSGSYDWKIPSDVAADSGYILTIVSREYPDFYDVSDAPFSIGIETAGLTITTPNGGEELEVGSEQKIEWESKGSIEKVKIELSTDNGGSWKKIKEETNNSGLFDWMVDSVETDKALIRITSKDGAVKDVSDAVFSIAYGDAIIDIEGSKAEAVSGFRVGPNPVSYGDAVLFQVTPSEGAIVSGEVVVLDVLGNRVHMTPVSFVKEGETAVPGSWNLRMSSGRAVGRGTYQAVLVVELASGDVYRIRRNFTVTD